MKKRNVMKLCVLMLLMAMLFSGCDALRESDPNKDYSGETDAPTESVSANETAEPSDTDNETKPDGQPEEPEETEETEETEEQTAEVESATEETESTEPASILYEDYRDMSASEQKAYFESFSSTQAFFEWFNAAKKDYADRNPGIEIDTGVVYP